VCFKRKNVCFYTLMECIKCRRKNIKYRCIGCKIPICNVCSVACSEKTPGYCEKKYFLGTCDECQTSSSKKRPFSEPRVLRWLHTLFIIGGLVPNLEFSCENVKNICKNKYNFFSLKSEPQLPSHVYFDVLSLPCSHLFSKNKLRPDLALNIE
jgi:hypothetical protein